MATERKMSSAMRFLEEVYGASLSLGDLLRDIRMGEEMSQVAFAEKLGIFRSHLCDLEKGRKSVGIERAVRFAKILGYSERQFARLALQSLLDGAGLNFKVSLDAA